MTPFKLGGEFLVNSTTNNDQSGTSSVGLLSGGFAVFFDDDSQSGDDSLGSALRGQIFDGNGNEAGSEFLLPTTTAGSQFASEATLLNNGRFVVVWVDGGQTGGDTAGLALRDRCSTRMAARLGTNFWSIP